MKVGLNCGLKLFSDTRCNDRPARCSRTAAKALVVISLGLAAAGIASGMAQSSTAGASSPQVSERKDGATVFHESGCEYCHGADAAGTERAPDLSTVGKRLSKEQIEHQIRNGGKSMPAFGDALEPDQIQALVEFLHAKKKAAHAKKDRPASPDN